ncbi:hypothetical protein GF345_05590 [Candidatus Woesearchaeota archaeon]|nr:hypothetical protein [Candidatus Woesearchaeota archaeon]
MMISRKAQVRMMESVMILIIFFIIVVLGFMFYSRIQQGSIQEMQRQRAEENAVAIVQNMLYMPEIQCSEKSVMIDICFDIYKLDAFSERIDPRVSANRNAFLFYQQDFGDSMIQIRPIFPDQKDPYLIYNNTPLDDAEQSFILTSIPVSLKDPTKRNTKYSIGILDVKVFT